MKAAQRHLTLVPPATELPKSFAVGDSVVYASHGIGRVEAMGLDSNDAETITLGFESGLRVTLPVERAFETLRPISCQSELDEVEITLKADVPPSAEPWTRRHRVTREKVTCGRVGDLAEVVRDGLQREQRRIEKGGAMTAPSDRELYLRARALLTAEIALCRGIEPAEADAWIVEQVGPYTAQA